MFKRLFGETESEQLKYLQIRVIITLIVLLATAVMAILFKVNISAVVALLMLFLWGWNTVKSMFGVTTVAAVFSGNIVIGVILFLLYIILSYIIGVFIALIGIGRYIFLKIKLTNADKHTEEAESETE